MSSNHVVPSVYLERGTSAYPARVEAALGADAPAVLSTLGNLELLNLPLLALFSSILTPPDLILRSFDLARKLRTGQVPVISGFQSPVERECLALLLRGSQPLVIVLPRDLESMRVPTAWRVPLRDERMLLIAPVFRRKRPTLRTALIRNRLVAALANRVLVIHARPGSRTYRIAAESIRSRKEVYCFEHRRNLELILVGAQPADAQTILRFYR